MMQQLITDFPKHLAEAIAIYKQTHFKSPEGFQNIVISGLGGSGIGASIALDWVSASAGVPIVINKTYQIPGFANGATVFIAVSYSGNTEETLMATKEAMARGCTILAITSGGTLAQMAAKHNFPVVMIPGGNPPRSMLGYALVVLLGYFDLLGLAKFEDVEAACAAFTKNLQNGSLEIMHTETKALAKATAKLIPVTYASTGLAGTATRWRQQLNENAKLPGWDAAIPEMNHNELVGWAGGSDQFVVYFLRSSFDFDRNAKRTDIAIERLSKIAKVVPIEAQGTTPLEQALYLIHFGDWLSFYLSEERQVDIMDIEIIDYLKATLDKFNT
jgi:glucose/mannose-6-phosphate isomerase